MQALAIDNLIEEVVPVLPVDFDVALHVVFDSREAHDAYQTAPRHNQFIDENKPNWERVRVFDSYVS